MTSDGFEFLRPLWLLGIPVVIALTIALSRWQTGNDWSRFIPADKLAFLTFDQTARSRNWRWLAGIAWIIVCIALAGPSFSRIPQPVSKNRDALVIVFDLSPSMLATDLKPSRLARARLKLIDLLRLRDDGETALIVYAGDAHRVAPLTEDTNNIENLVPTLHPNIMPSVGSNIEAALTLAKELLTGAGLSKGDVLLITDGVDTDAVDAVGEIVKNSMRLFILGVGSSQGAPIPGPEGGFVRDDNGQVIISQLDEDLLNALAQDNDGLYVSMQTNNAGIEWLSSMTRDAEAFGEVSLDQEFDQREDVGYWLLLLLIPLALLAFRRNVVWLLVLVLPIAPDTTMAFEWADLWSRRDQQGAKALADENPQKAADLFNRNDWQGIARYKSGDYETAGARFAEENSAIGHYNHGNALALQGKLPEASKAYERALELQPDFEDAQHNKRLVDELLKQSQEQDQQNQQQQNDQQQNQDQQQDDSSQENQSSEQQQEQEQQQADQEQEQSKEEQEQSQGQQDQEQDSQQQSAQQQQSEQDQQPPDQSQQSASQQDSAQQGTDKQTEAATDGGEQVEEQEKPEEEEQQQMTQGEEQENTEQTPLSPRSEQWLRSLPEDRGGLMRRKFQYEAFKRQREGNVNNRQQKRY